MREAEARIVDPLQAFQPLPGAVRIDDRRAAATVARAPRRATQASQAVERLDQAIAQRQQVAHIVERVLDLLVGQRSPRPVGARLRLGQLDFEQPAHQFAVTDLCRQARQRSGHLRVEHAADRAEGGQSTSRSWRAACSTLTLVAAPSGVASGATFSRAIGSTQTVPLGQDLQQAQFGAIGPLTQEFGVQRDAGCSASAAQTSASAAGSVRNEWATACVICATICASLCANAPHLNRSHSSEAAVIVKLYLDIALLRREPYDLPASPWLLAVTLGVFLALNAVLTQAFRPEWTAVPADPGVGGVYAAVVLGAAAPVREARALPADGDRRDRLRLPGYADPGAAVRADRPVSAKPEEAAPFLLVLLPVAMYVI